MGCMLKDYIVRKDEVEEELLEVIQRCTSDLNTIASLVDDTLDIKVMINAWLNKRRYALKSKLGKIEPTLELVFYIKTKGYDPSTYRDYNIISFVQQDVRIVIQDFTKKFKKENELIRKLVKSSLDIIYVSEYDLKKK